MITRQQFLDFIKEEFFVEADYPFDNDYDAAIFRHKDNRKWFALVMKVARNKFVGNDNRLVEVANLKCEPLLRQPLMQNRGIYTAYHMNKVHWISIILEEITLEELRPLVEMSYDLTAKKKRA